MKLKVLYGLPRKVLFCKKTLMSNQRPVSTSEFLLKSTSKKKTINFSKNRISDSYVYSKKKEKINYEDREKKLLKLLSKHRGKYGKYDCIVPGSGGKDSCFATHILKYKYGMNPLTVTWPPILYTDYGYQNYLNWIKTCKVDNVTPNRNKKTMKLLTRLALENLFHPFQTFILGQKIFATRIALKYKIPLVFFGENEAEHGNPIADNLTSIRKAHYFAVKSKNKIRLGGVLIKDLINNYGISNKDLEIFLPIKFDEIYKNNLEVHYLGYYLNWIPQETYYYAVKNCNFRPRPFRTQGTYSKYNSIDDKIDDLHYYTTYIKFGIGRATYDVSQEIRNKHLSIEEGKKLIKKYDGEFPDRYFSEILRYLDIKPNKFFKLQDKFRSPHLWKKIKKKWYLRHNCWGGGVDDK